MSAAAVSTLPVVSPQATPQAPTQTTVSKESTYLSRCVEKLDAKHIAGLGKNAFLYKVAAYAAVVLYGILATSGFVATGLFAPVFLPIAAITAICFLPGIMNIYAQIMNKSQHYASNLEDCQDLKSHYSTLENTSTEQVQALLQQNHIDWANIPGMRKSPAEIQRLKPLIARLNQWKEKAQTFSKERADTQAEIATIMQNSPVEKLETRKKLMPLRNHLLETEHAILKAKTNAAFIHAVIQRPDFRGDADTVYSFTEIEPIDRLLREACGHDLQRLPQFVHFKGEGQAPITAADIIAADLNNLQPLSTRILAAM